MGEILVGHLGHVLWRKIRRLCVPQGSVLTQRKAIDKATRLVNEFANRMNNTGVQNFGMGDWQEYHSELKAVVNYKQAQQEMDDDKAKGSLRRSYRTRRPSSPSG